MTIIDKLKNIQAITTSTGRLYKTEVGDLPSITTVLSKTSYMPWLEKWKERVGEEEAARVSKVATDRGTKVHDFLERYWDNRDISDLSSENQDVQYMTRNLINATKDNVTKVYCQEIVVYDKLLKIAGRLDKAGEWKGTPAIIDYKTSKKEKAISSIKDYFIQTAFYAKSYNQLFGTNIKKVVILITTETNTVQVFESIADAHIPDLLYRANTFYKDPANLKVIQNATKS